MRPGCGRLVKMWTEDDERFERRLRLACEDAGGKDMFGFGKDVVDAVREGGDNRRRVFDYWETEYGERLGKGRRGAKIYYKLLQIVKKTNDSQAMTQFRDRFAPLCDQTFVGTDAPGRERAPKRILNWVLTKIRRLFGR
jgi:hypothetical protein